MNYVYVCFIRHEGKRQGRGVIAGKPLAKFPTDPRKFIVVKVDPTTIPATALTDDTITLRLGDLMLQYPNKPVEGIDEDGNPTSSINYGYFHSEGQSMEKDCPVITFDDCYPLTINEDKEELI